MKESEDTVASSAIDASSEIDAKCTACRHQSILLSKRGLAHPSPRCRGGCGAKTSTASHNSGGKKGKTNIQTNPNKKYQHQWNYMLRESIGCALWTAIGLHDLIQL